MKIAPKIWEVDRFDQSLEVEGKEAPDLALEVNDQILVVDKCTDHDPNDEADRIPRAEQLFLRKVLFRK